MNNNFDYQIGIDIGSTTAKIAVLELNGTLIFSDYLRHNTRIHQTLVHLLNKAQKNVGDKRISIQTTGSAGIGVSEKTGIPFIQEVVASTHVIKKYFPQVKTLIDIGGEDSKMIFFNDNKPPDIRMNGSCAGGTGAFIDQMATLLNVELKTFNDLAKNHKTIYPIASRCGVFAKTDVQNLISRKISPEDIAASVFHAVVVQTMNTLARGYDIVPKVMYIGGPFTFLPELNHTFTRNLPIQTGDLIIPEHPELLPALGAAVSRPETLRTDRLSVLQNKIKQADKHVSKSTYRLQPLFENDEIRRKWSTKHKKHQIKRTALHHYKEKICFLGIDSGSTTTKIVITGTNDELLFTFYANNKGNPVGTVKEGLMKFEEFCLNSGAKKPTIAASAVTGYGEDLIKAAFGIGHGIVETIAHYKAAAFFNPNVSFILDIGGQDMKAIFIENGMINRIELNEACSSGCGSFIETFGKALGYKVGEFAELACRAQSPADLGTRCTVFMNSKVKQSLRENASIEDIAAGLSVSVIKNALYKVLKIKEKDELGEHIVLQGGAFRNPSVLRAFEMLTGKETVCSDIPELMGAFGAAMFAKDRFLNEKAKSLLENNTLDRISITDDFITKNIYCNGCVNHCVVTKFVFKNGNTFFSGNKCEKIFSNKGEKHETGFNFFEYKNNIIFNRQSAKSELRIGIPRVLNMYENYPFWHSLFTHCGIETVLSDESSLPLYKKGLGTVMSDSICFPAKLVNGHIFQLAEKKINRIFYPIVIYEAKEYAMAQNTFNCPIVSSYPDVIRSAVNPEKRFGIPFDSPTINFTDIQLLKKACFRYLKQFGVTKKVFQKAFKNAIRQQNTVKKQLLNKGSEIIERAKQDNRFVVVLAGRPYQDDALINHKTPAILSDFGIDVLTVDAIPNQFAQHVSELQIIPQWAYPNKIFNAVHWIARQPQQFQLVQFNSFGCGPDAIAIDEVTEILRTNEKSHTVIKIDDISSTGSIKLRLRSMFESWKMKKSMLQNKKQMRQSTVSFMPDDQKKRTILGPYFGEMYSPFFPVLFEIAGYKLINLPKPDKESVQLGLKYSNNEICYPATVIIGDVIKALQSGKYKREEIAIGISQTGGQCRASTYLSLIKKGMIAAGYQDIPVIAVSATSADAINPQPGFKIQWLKILKPVFTTFLYADSLAKMYYSTIVREKNKGETEKTLDFFQKKVIPFVREKNINGIFATLEEAVDAFNEIDIDDSYYPKIGIVGEIYVKYNSFGHQYIIDWLIKQGVEVVVPPILEFFIQDFVNVETNKKSDLRRAKFSDIFVSFLEGYANRIIKKVDKINSAFRLHQPFHKLRDMSKRASRIINLANQFGEGWLIPAEMATFAEEGIENVVSVQPFGCIANHIISKGIEKRLRDLYPNMNLLFLDFDDGATEVNILNRLHFMVKNVKEAGSVKWQKKQTLEIRNISNHEKKAMPVVFETIKKQV